MMSSLKRSVPVFQRCTSKRIRPNSVQDNTDISINGKTIFIYIKVLTKLFKNISNITC